VGDLRRHADLSSYRQVIFPDFPPNLVTTKFVLGLPPFAMKPFGEEADDRVRILKELHKEMEEHNDMIILPVSYVVLWLP
jgi:hypothetical protein